MIKSSDNSSTMFWSLVLLCGLTLAQYAAESANTQTTEKNDCTDICGLLKQFGSMEEKIRVLENQQKESSKQIEELKNKGTAESNTVIWRSLTKLQSLEKTVK